MKKITAIILSIFILLGIYYPCNIFAASIPTTTITSVKAQSKAFTVKWKKKSVKNFLFSCNCVYL